MTSRILWVLAIAVWCVLACGASCSSRKPAPTHNTIDTPVKVEAPLPSSVKDLEEEKKNLKARLTLVENALEDKKNEEIQLKIWLGVGALVLAGIILVFLGVYTSRTFLLSLGVGAFGLAALGVLAAALVPYILWIGIGVSAIVLAAAIYMLLNREKALRQVTKAVESSKERIPGFREHYRDIFNGEIDTGIDTLLNSIRGVKK